MNNTLQLTITLNPSIPWTEIIISELSDLGFDAFEELENGLKAYGPENKIRLSQVLEETILSDESLEFDFNIEQEIIPFQKGEFTYRIFDALGKEIQNETKLQEIICIENLAEGYFYLEISNEDGFIQNYKFIKH